MKGGIISSRVVMAFETIYQDNYLHNAELYTRHYSVTAIRRFTYFVLFALNSTAQKETPSTLFLLGFWGFL